MLIKERTQLEEKFWELGKGIVQENDLELYDLEFSSNNCTLTLFIMDPKTGTAVIEDCVKIDRALSEPFEELDWIPQDIILEVSSPGAYRNLNTKEHFELAIGQRIKCKLEKNLLDLGGTDLPKSVSKNHSLLGVLNSVEDENIIINIADQDVSIGLSNIKKANLEPEFN